MTLQQALDWISQKGEDFAAAHQRIVRGRERAASVARVLPKGSPERAEAGEVVNRWSQLLADHQRAWARWNDIAERVPGLEPTGTLGVVPVVPLALAGAVIAVAGSMALILRRVTAEERALALLDRGSITPAQAIELASNLEGGSRPSILPSLAGAGLPLLAVGAALLFLRR